MALSSCVKEKHDDERFMGGQSDLREILFALRSMPVFWQRCAKVESILRVPVNSANV